MPKRTGGFIGPPVHLGLCMCKTMKSILFSLFLLVPVVSTVAETKEWIALLKPENSLEQRARACQRLGEAVDPAFGGGVVDLAILSGLAIDRPDVDDAAPARLYHPRHERAAAEEHI